MELRNDIVFSTSTTSHFIHVAPVFPPTSLARVFLTTPSLVLENDLPVR